MDRAQMRAISDDFLNKGAADVVVLGTATAAGTVEFTTAVRKELAGEVHAGKLVGAASAAAGGKGGGRPDRAEGGGKDPAKLGEALAAVEQMLQ
jgi:alanyl-tRNA synthetase